MFLRNVERVHGTTAQETTIEKSIFVSVIQIVGYYFSSVATLVL